MHLTRTTAAAAALLGALWVNPTGLRAQQTATPDSDNTRVNERDRAKSAPTADQAKNRTSDLETARKIRRSLMDDKSLSTNAHNVKVIAQNGKVTLKGPVASDEEKREVEQKATEVAGQGNVTNEITVKAAASKTGAAPADHTNHK
jgi:hyperosmotically inducible periplasmic protein